MKRQLQEPKEAAQKLVSRSILKAAATGTTKSRKKRIDESSSLRNQGKNDSRSCREQK